MSKISDADSDSAPTVLLVDNNEMSLLRLREIFRQRDFAVEECKDGDKAVDEYIRLDPELVVLSLDIPSLDGHVAALEMREHGGDGRIIFTAPKHLRALAEEASNSAGAVAWVEKPVTNSFLDEIWDTVLGDVPDAPGLEDLDTLHPGDDLPLIEVEDDAEPVTLPPLPLPLPVTGQSEIQNKKGGRKLKIITLLILLGAGYFVTAYLGYVTDYTGLL